MPELLAAGYSVRCMARDPGKLSDRPWSAQVEIMAADALDRSGVRQALDGIDVAYYLIHSLGTGSSFEQRDRDSARIFADAARAFFRACSSVSVARTSTRRAPKP